MCRYNAPITVGLSIACARGCGWGVALWPGDMVIARMAAAGVGKCEMVRTHVLR